MLITIITPTYNRKKEIQNLYQSLCNQTSNDFKWLIVDDGSTDGTKDIVGTWNSKFQIDYIYQNNRGKHRALNKGIRSIDTPFTFIVDSDDILIENAIEDANSELEKVLDRSEICGIGYLRGYTKDKVIGDLYPENYLVDDFIVMRFRNQINGDKAEIWRTSDLQATPFPEFEGENFISESSVWCKLAYEKKMVFINRIIYITEYLNGGLSKSGRSMRINCPNGGMLSANMMMNPRFDIKNRLKGGILYSAYSGFARKKFGRCFRESESKIVFLLTALPGRVLYYYWRNKFN